MKGQGKSDCRKRPLALARWSMSAAMLLLAGLGSASAQDVGEFDLLIHDTRRGETISITDTPGFGEFNAGFSPNGKTVLYEVIEETFSIPPYLALTYSSTFSRPLMQKSTSISGILMRAGLRKRSKIKPCSIGSRSVMPMA